MKKLDQIMKRIFSVILAILLAVETFSMAGYEGVKALIVQAEEKENGYEIDNGYIKVTVSGKNGGFGIRTLTGDKVNKDDDNKYLLFEYDDDNTSFTSFQVKRGEETKEYIFGKKYDGSSDLQVKEENNAIVATWSVDDLTFTQTVKLIESGANEHGAVNISYAVKNIGTPADIKCRILMDTALGYDDYAYYNIGDSANLIDGEISIKEDGYNKSFYAVNDPDYPTMSAYTINASINNEECKPYKATFAHWNNLAATVFDYEPDADMTFVNSYNKKYLTADSAYALYFSIGNVAASGEATIGTNYGIFSNEAVTQKETVTVNVIAPDVMEYAKDASDKENQDAYENDGIFTTKTYIEHIGDKSYDKIKILVYATGGIDPLDQEKKPTNSTYDNPYSMEIKDFNPEELQNITWYFKATPMETGQYAKIHYKVYNISDDATQNTGQIMVNNLLGEGYSYILCPGSVNKIPSVKFTGLTPETIYTEGNRSLYLTGENFSMLADTGDYKLRLNRVDGVTINGKDYLEIPMTQVKRDDYNNTITITMTDESPGKLPEGMYQMTVDYTEETKEDLSGPALRFEVKNDVKFKNDAYGFLAVIKVRDDITDTEPSYMVRNFASEEEYLTEIKENRLDRDTVLLEWKGTFIKNDENKDDKIVTYEGISLSDSDNVMTLNDCLDVNNGTVTITEEDGSVTVDFEADISTTGAGTAVWTGVATLTELEKGENFCLIPYNEDGDRKGFGKERNPQVIALMWPSVGQGFQNLMGMLFDLKYGELGVMEHSENAAEDTRIVGFGAAMDLSFIVPDGNPSYSGRTKDYLGSSYDAADHSIKFSPEEVRALNKRAGGHNVGTTNTDATSWKDRFTEIGTDMGNDASGGDGDSKSASIQIDDVLFGGKFLGVNMAIALGLPCYVDGMPALESLLTIRTVGDWAFGVSGVCNFELFYLEGSISIMSKDGIPIPDALTFFLGGIEPGINLDGFGVLWLQGAGGGIENIYDTIFLSEVIPPIRLILEAQMSLMQVISARATLGLSLRGVSVSLTNGKLVNALPVLNYASVGLDWYPEFYFMGNVQVSILGAIKGGGYIVVEESGFFEFFIRALLQIPDVIPVFGGIEIAEANLGANLDKIWGQVEALGLPLGITYYWGGDIDWNSGAEVVPTYPELAGMEGYSGMTFAVGRNEETEETLYASVGTNLRMSARTMAMENEPVTNTTTTEDILQTTDLSLSTTHNLTLAKTGNGKLLLIEWEAESEEQARKDVLGDDATENSGISIVNLSAAEGEESVYNLNLLEHDADIADGDNPNANANLTYNEETKKATLAVSFTKEKAFDVPWTIHTPEGASLVLYNVAPLPTLTELGEGDVTVKGNEMSVKVSGSKLEEFAHLSFVAESEDGESALLYKVENDDNGTVAQNAISFTLPETLSSGKYTLHVQAWDDNAKYYSEVEAEFEYTNSNAPSAPTIASTANAGDYKAMVTLEEDTSTDYEGYVLSAYKTTTNEENETVTEPVSGVTDLMYYKDGSALEYDDNGSIKAFADGEQQTEFIIGGQYVYPFHNEETGEEETRIAGFSAGDYTISVKKWKRADDGVSIIYSEPGELSVTIKEPVKTEIVVTPIIPVGTNRHEETIVQKEATETEDAITYKQTSFNSNTVTLTLSSAITTDIHAFTGRWELDGGTKVVSSNGDTKEYTKGEIKEAANSVTLSFEDLEEGTHTLEFFGKNANGDATSVKYMFTVDTQGPRLMLSKPLNGSFFDYWSGNLSVTGVTDKDAKLTIVDSTTGMTIFNSSKNSGFKVDDTGHFSIDITLDRTIVEHEMLIRVEDNLGNSTEKEITVTSDGLSNIEDLRIYEGNTDVTNTKLQSGGIHALSLVAKLKRPDSAKADEKDLYVTINLSEIVEWNQRVVAGEAELNETENGITIKTTKDAEGMITAAYLISDAGAYPINVAFGDLGKKLKELSDETTKITVNDAFYTSKEVRAKVEVWYKDTKLNEGTDYQLTYKNNVNVSTGKWEKPEVTIEGMGNYIGRITKKFEISYLPLDKNSYTINGTKGNGSYYTSDTVIRATSGYQIITDVTKLTAGNIAFTKEQEHEATFWVRRISDGALTDKVTVKLGVDKTAPTGTISLGGKFWNKFLSFITFGLYKADTYAVSIDSADNYSGVSSVQYVISNKAYASIAELNATNLEWKTYSSVAKPTISAQGKYIVYAKVTDKAGNITYLSSEGIELEAPLTSEEKTMIDKLGITNAGAKQLSEFVAANGISEDMIYITEESITKQRSEDIKGATFAMFAAKTKKTTKNKVYLSWNKVKGADGYIVYGNKCGTKNKYKKIATLTSGNKKSYIVSKVNKKKLTKGTYYKFVVIAYKLIDGKKVTIHSSKTIHAATTGGKYTNTKSITVKNAKKSKVTIKRKKSLTLKVSEVKQSKKLKMNAHKKLAFESTNTKIATVNKKGKITAKKKGTCYVYVYAQNGVYKKIKVTVK